MTTLFIQPTLNNPDTKTKIIYGKNISSYQVIEFVKKDVELKESCGVITFAEAEEIVRQTREVLKNEFQEI